MPNSVESLGISRARVGLDLLKALTVLSDTTVRKSATAFTPQVIQ